MDPENKKLLNLISKIPLSRQTVERRITDISNDTVIKLKDDAKHCLAFSLALDESTDVRDIPQLAVFIHFVSANFCIKEEFLDLVALKESTRGIDIKNAFNDILNNFDLPLKKLICIATDGAPAMTGNINGFIGLL